MDLTKRTSWGLWESIPKPVRTLLDVGRILYGLGGWVWLGGVAMSGLAVAAPFFFQLPLGAKIGFAITGTALAMLVVGHIGAWLKDRKRGGRSGTIITLPPFDHKKFEAEIEPREREWRAERERFEKKYRKYRDLKTEVFSTLELLIKGNDSGALWAVWTNMNAGDYWPNDQFYLQAFCLMSEGEARFTNRADFNAFLKQLRRVQGFLQYVQSLPEEFPEAESFLVERNVASHQYSFVHVLWYLWHALGDVTHGYQKDEKFTPLPRWHRLWVEWNPSSDVPEDPKLLLDPESLSTIEAVVPKRPGYSTPSTPDAEVPPSPESSRFSVDLEAVRWVSGDDEVSVLRVKNEGGLNADFVAHIEYEGKHWAGWWMNARAGTARILAGQQDELLCFVHRSRNTGRRDVYLAHDDGGGAANGEHHLFCGFLEGVSEVMEDGTEKPYPRHQAQVVVTISTDPVLGSPWVGELTVDAFSCSLTNEGG